MRRRLVLICSVLMAHAALACAAHRSVGGYDGSLVEKSEPDAASSGEPTSEISRPPPLTSPWANRDPRVPIVIRGWMDPPYDSDRDVVSVRFQLDENGDVQIVEEDDEENSAGDASSKPESQLLLAYPGPRHWTLSIVDGWAKPLECSREEGRFLCGDTTVIVEEASPRLPPDEGAWALWSDVDERVRLTSPLFHECCDDVLDEAAERQALEEADELEHAGRTAELLDLVRGLPHLRLHGWHEMRERAIHAANHELVVELFLRTGLSLGRCSHDGSPLLEMRQYADSCLALRRTNCFLNLMVRVLGNQVERMIYSNLAHARFESQAAHLGKADIDVARFLLGLVVTYRVTPPRAVELDEQSIAKAIRAADLKDELVPQLITLVENEALDEANRLRATVTLFFLLLPPSPPEPVRGNAEEAVHERHQAETERYEQLLEVARVLAGARQGRLGSAFLEQVVRTTQAELDDMPRQLQRSLELHRRLEEMRKQREERWNREEKARETQNARRRRSTRTAPAIDPDSRDPFCEPFRKSGLGKQMPAKTAEEVRRKCGPMD